MLPDWLNGALKQLELSPDAVPEPPQPSPTVNTKWCEEVELCQSLQEIKELAAPNGVASQDSKASRQAFRYLCSLQPTPSVLLEFLADRGLNTPVAGNLSFLLGHIQERLCLEGRASPWRRQASLKLSAWITFEVQSGNLLEKEIREILRWASVPNLHALRELRAIRIRTIRAVFDGFLSSSIRPAHSAQPATIRCLIRALASPCYMHARTQRLNLTSSLIQRASNDDVTRMLTYTRLFVRSFLSRTENSPHFARAFRILLWMMRRESSYLAQLLEDAHKTRSKPGLHKEWLRYFLTQTHVYNSMPQDLWEACMQDLGGEEIDDRARKEMCGLQSEAC